jgi:hypothetical protein
MSLLTATAARRVTSRLAPSALRPRGLRARCAAPGLVALGLGLTLWASSARADIYWSNSGSNTIGRASLTGANANQNFITGAGTPWQVAVSGARIFWANSTGSIGRANLDGSSVNQNFVATGISSNEGPLGVAVTPSFVYFATGVQADFNLIGRADSSGAHPVSLQPFLSAVQLAIRGPYVYFTTGGNQIGRMNLDGSNLVYPFIALPAGTFSQGVAVDDNYIYWSLLGGAIGRDTLDGNPANLNSSFIGCANADGGVAVSHSYIYWTNYHGGTIGRDTLDGNPAQCQQAFISGANLPAGVAVHQP